MGWCGGVWSEVLDLPRPLPTSLWDAGCGSEVSESSKGVSGKEWGCSGKGHGWFLGLVLLQASRKAGTRGKAAATKQAQRGSSNVFSMFEQAQIQEFKEAFSCIDQNRDGIICKSDLRETYSQLGKVNVPEEELDAMLQEGKGPINFTVFLTLFGEKLNGTDPEEAILSAFRLFDPSGKGVVNRDEFKQLLLTQADKFSLAEVEQMFALTPMDLAGNIDYKSLCYIITHGDEKEE
ncbi:myosin regulatory light chain 2, atrial isoform isoform X1 [Pseudorca crassidens]|uniref:myosin regulatory light chain 2, atrial isoform isoform X1 n=1 Tax=Pseudorca crassidens TaxID=82174 RepID=UPI00352FD5A7